MPCYIPYWIYSSNYDYVDYPRMLRGGVEPTKYIESLKQWGKLLDAFLISREDYILLDFLVNAFHAKSPNDEHGLLKAYSLCQLFLDRESERDLDVKLVRFMPALYSESERRECALVLRQLRNKLAHGDFAAFERKIELFAQRFMDSRFWFDYTELSRRNWALSYARGLLDGALRQMIEMLFVDREELNRIKMGG
ncbi:MAG: hypothetical protein K6F70_07565 [Eggerthellaceae bacterium]|nr:hypothetical protein [Eggerthellaceae bacterium]